MTVLPDPASPFGIDNLPYGVVHVGADTRIGVRVGDTVLDLAASDLEVSPDIRRAWSTDTLNAFIDLGPQAWHDARAAIRAALTGETASGLIRHDLDAVRPLLPIAVADYVDFYASEHHAANVGRIFRPHTDPLPANWKHLPIGYHGRSGTVVVSGTPVVRPHGQRRPGADGRGVFGPSIKLDIEAELGFIVGGSTRLGRTVPIDAAANHIFGAVVLNDWSARDIQAWEYVPLGPFLGKSFATSISPWVVPMAALRDARVPLAQHDPTPLGYLRPDTGAQGIDVHLSVGLNGTTICTPEYSDMYWAPEQMLAHTTVNGASLRTGDLFGSGTISGPVVSRYGSLLELTVDGREPLRMPDGSERSFLADGDTVTIDAWAPGPDGAKIGFGEVVGTILPAGD